jgi:hypothetical protein
MKLTRKLAISAALTGSLLVTTAALSFAQGTPIANGHLKGGPTPAAPAPSIIDLTISLVELPDGSLVGGGKLERKSAGGWILFDLTSYIFVGDTLYAAGPVTQNHNTPGVWQVGATFFVAINDNDGSADADSFIEGGVPAEAGPVTIEQILAVIGPAPPAIFRQ